MRVDDIAPPSGDTWKPEIGDTIKGEILYAESQRGESYDKKRTEETLRIVLDTEDGEQIVFATTNTDVNGGGYPKKIARAIAAAVRAEKETELLVGGTLAIKRVEDVPTDFGAAKNYVAQYVAPAAPPVLPDDDAADGAVTGLI